MTTPTSGLASRLLFRGQQFTYMQRDIFGGKPLLTVAGSSCLWSGVPCLIHGLSPHLWVKIVTSETFNRVESGHVCKGLQRNDCEHRAGRVTHQKRNLWYQLGLSFKIRVHQSNRKWGTCRKKTQVQCPLCTGVLWDNALAHCEDLPLILIS